MYDGRYVTVRHRRQVCLVEYVSTADDSYADSSGRLTMIVRPVRHAVPKKALRGCSSAGYCRWQKRTCITAGSRALEAGWSPALGRSTSNAARGPACAAVIAMPRLRQMHHEIATARASAIKPVKHAPTGDMDQHPTLSTN